MDTFELTKIVGATCGALLVFLVFNTGADSLFASTAPSHHGASGEEEGEEVLAGYPIEVEEAASDEGGEATEEVPFAELYAAADAAAGEKEFKACQSCHKLEAGANATGPYLHGVVDRPVASATGGFAYSEGMAGHGGNWDPESLNAFLTNPKEYVPGTKMNFKGISDPQDRANLIAYLATVK
jgi:cytochrome c